MPFGCILTGVDSTVRMTVGPLAGQSPALHQGRAQRYFRAEPCLRVTGPCGKDCVRGGVVCRGWMHYQVEWEWRRALSCEGELG